MSKRFHKETISGYEIKVKDYQYKSRPPVGVIVNGTKLGENTNTFGEPCYFFASDDAYSMSEGIARAKAIVTEQLIKQRKEAYSALKDWRENLPVATKEDLQRLTS